MAITLQKGGNVSLSKTDPNLRQVLVGLGWAARASDGADFDLDASLFMVQENGKVRSDADFIFYNQLISTCGAITHTGDNKTGAGDGDDEALTITLATVPAAITRLVIAVTIHDAVARKQNFGMVEDAFVRIVNSETCRKIIRPRPRWCLRKSTATATSGNSRPWGRAMRAVSQRSPPSTASTSHDRGQPRQGPAPGAPA
jgi:tellurium resistance protein TerD